MKRQNQGSCTVENQTIVKDVSNQCIELQVSDSTIEWFAISGYDPQFGARPVMRVIQKNILNELSRQILSGKNQVGKPIKINYTMERLVFDN